MLEADMRALEGGQSVSPVAVTPPPAPEQPEAGTAVSTVAAEAESQPPSDAASESVALSSTNTTAPPLASGMSRGLTSTAAPAAVVAPVAGQTDILPIRSCEEVARNLASASTLEKFFCARVAVIDREKRRADTPVQGLDLRRDFFFFMIALLAREGRAEYVLAAEEERTDKQVSANASNSGSTSLVSKGSVPAILGFAVDSGALLRSTSGSTITFRGNFAGLAKAVAGDGFISGFDEDSPATRFLRRASFGISFDPTRGSTSGVFTGTRQQISSYTLHLDIYNKRDARLSRYKKDWDTFLSQQGADLSTQIQKSLLVLTDPFNNKWNDPALQAWYVVADSEIRNANGIAQIDAVLRAQLNKAPQSLTSTVLAELRSFDTRFEAWLNARESILDKIAKAPIISFDYLNDHPADAPAISRFNLIAEKGLGGRFDLTFNGAIGIFNEKPLDGFNRIRDFQFALQFDAPLGEIGLGLGKPVFSFGGRYERLMNDEILGNLRRPNTQGDIAVGQLKLTIPIKKSGVKIPLSLSFANRTELLKEKEVRGNFGFTFDMDTLFSLFKPF
ncbi:MAG: hypothetical protein JO360_03255 [Acidobacteria bacterium]|nr:hypothetical protein [Acidobacteriota bacterium]